MTNNIPKWVTQLTESDVKLLMESDKEVMKEFARWVSEPNKVVALQDQVTRLSQENLRLRTIIAENDIRVDS